MPQARKTILIVDDEPNIVLGLRDALEFEGFRVISAVKGQEAVALARTEAPDAVVLDLMLPDMNGYAVCEQLRRINAHVPIVMLTARSQETDKIRGLDAGADDYVTKPFGMDELLARLRAALRRKPAGPEDPRVETEDFIIDLASKQVTREGSDVHLTPKEWDILEVLVRNPGKLVSQQQLLHDVWGPEYDTETEYLRVLMARVRRKLESDPSRPRHFRTEPGMGYRFVP
jgi:two-component system KDP operon response regulator KdpE